MNPHVQALNELLLSLSTESDLHQVACRFLELAEDKSFITACKPARNKDFVRIVAIGLKSKLNLDTSRMVLTLSHYPRFDFFHGGGLVADRIVQCFYFRREKRGCITVASLAGEVHYLRISGLKSPTPKEPERN